MQLLRHRPPQCFELAFIERCEIGELPGEAVELAFLQPGRLGQSYEKGIGLPAESGPKLIASLAVAVGRFLPAQGLLLPPGPFDTVETLNQVADRLTDVRQRRHRFAPHQHNEQNEADEAYSQ
jgi:hypothetical protein